MKTLSKLSPIFFLFIILTTTSCLKDNEDSPYVPTAALRMVNAYSNAPAIIFTENNYYITSPSSPLRYSEYTSNLALLFPGNKHLKVYDNQNRIISDTTINLKDSTYYTSFVFGNTIKAKNIITTDIPLKDLETNTAMRFLHLASNIGNVNVYDGEIGNALFSDRTPELSANTLNVANTLFSVKNSGKRKIIITDTENNMLIEREYDFIKSRYYSIILIGDKNSTTSPLYLGIIQQF